MAKAKPTEIGGRKFPTKGAALAYLRSILNSYDLEERLSCEDECFLVDALSKHPNSEGKVGHGIDYLFVRRADYGTRCFWVRRLDGSEEKFSYRRCV